jgi:hypothetical protein
MLKSFPSGLVTSGSHCTVRLGHSKAWVITKSYRNGVFFFHILYSSLITHSSTALSKAASLLTEVAGVLGRGKERGDMEGWGGCSP